MLVPIARRVAPSTSSQNGSKYLVAPAGEFDLLSIDGCASAVETSVDVCVAIAGSPLSARLVAMLFPASSATHNSPVAIIIDITALKDILII